MQAEAYLTTAHDDGLDTLASTWLYFSSSNVGEQLLTKFLTYSIKQIHSVLSVKMSMPGDLLERTVRHYYYSLLTCYSLLYHVSYI